MIRRDQGQKVVFFLKVSEGSQKRICHPEEKRISHTDTEKYIYIEMFIEKGR